MNDELAIVYFGNDWFAENRTSSHHIARLLSRRFPMLYVESPGLRTPDVSARDFRKIVEKLQLAAAPPSPIHDQMWRMTLPQVPFRSVPGVPFANRVAGQVLIRRALKKVGFKRFISWLTVPHPHCLAGRLGEEFIVYYCVDDYGAIPGADADRVRHMDEDLTRRADLVFAVSEPLVEAKRALNPNTVYSPHGVDAELFGKACLPETAVAAAARDLPHPVVGFIGVFGPWMDIPLIEFLARSRPAWTFLFVGLVITDVTPLRRLPNVVFAGPQPYEMLPSWAKAFDVAVIPTVRTGMRKSANPLKLREYLAAGRAVVSVSTPAIAEFRAHISLADGPEEFLRCLEIELTSNSSDSATQRRNSVRMATWQSRVLEIERVVLRMAGKRYNLGEDMG